MSPFLNDAEEEVVELDTWTEEDGEEDPFENEEEFACEGEGATTDLVLVPDAFAEEVKVQPARGRSFPNLPKVSVSSLKVTRIIR